jgi:hypothetical protein
MGIDIKMGPSISQRESISSVRNLKVHLLDQVIILTRQTLPRKTGNEVSKMPA